MPQLPQLQILQTLPPAIDEVNEVAIWSFLLGLAGWMVREWWKNNLEHKHRKQAEEQIEKDWTNGEDTLTGGSNPGRTTSQLVKIVHQDLQMHKKETGRRFDRIIEDVGKIKGKLDID